MPDRAIYIVLGVFVGALLLVALGKVLWDRRPKKNAPLAPRLVESAVKPSRRHTKARGT